MQYLILLLGTFFFIVLLKAFLFENKKDDRKQRRDVCKRIVIFMLLISFVLEIAVFNFKSFEIVGKDYIQKSITLDTSQDKTEENSNVTVKENKGEYTYTITLLNLDEKIRNIDICPQTITNVMKCNIYYTDDATKQLTKVSKQSINLLGGNNIYNHMIMDLAGKAHSLQFEIASDRKITSVGIKTNYPVGFEFNIARFLMVCAGAAIWMLCITYRGRKEIVFGNNRRTRNAILICTAFQIIIVTVITFAVNIDTSTVTTTKGFNVFNNYIDYNDPYHEMAIAFSKGQINLNGLNAADVAEENEGIAQLEKLDNPYIWSERDDIKYKWDHAYYNGKYYSYFGVVPELITYFPAYMLTGNMLNTKFVCYIYLNIIIILMAWLIYNLAKRWKGKLNIPIVISCMMAMLSGSMIIYCIGGSKFYEIAVLSAIGFSLAGINIVIEACKTKKIDNVKLVFGAGFTALAVGCRPNFVLVSFIILPIIIPALINQSGSTENCIKKIFNKKNIKSIMAIAIPYMIIGIGLMMYNYVRFDSIMEFGARYQLTVYDIRNYSILDFDKLVIVIGNGLLMIPIFTNKFPFVGAVKNRPNLLGYYYQMTYYGIFANPFTWTCVMLPWSMKRGLKENKLRAFAMTTVVAAFAMSYITVLMGGASLRYAADYGWMFFIPITLIVFDLYAASLKKGLGRYMTVGIMILSFATLVMNLLIVISPSVNLLPTDNPRFYYWIERTVAFWKL